jgi:hypothetical protein
MYLFPLILYTRYGKRRNHKSRQYKLKIHTAIQMLLQVKTNINYS